MRSRLEARFAQFCDTLEWAWTYEPQCFASGEGQYLPDFRIGTDHTYYEIKPFGLYEHDDRALYGLWDQLTRWQRIIRASEPSAGLGLVLGDIERGFLFVPQDPKLLFLSYVHHVQLMPTGDF